MLEASSNNFAYTDRPYVRSCPLSKGTKKKGKTGFPAFQTTLESSFRRGPHWDDLLPAKLFHALGTRNVGAES